MRFRIGHVLPMDYQGIMAVFTQAGGPLRALGTCEAMDLEPAPNNINNVTLNHHDSQQLWELVAAARRVLLEAAEEPGSASA
ncbi:hypothetical protein [Streptomyces sp. NPDC059215]|uniref:hypothetical protein n=1 Tax=Streptomyces sp. NPDC059215 TaxID=3346772 RepID=UPI0036A041C0